MGSGNGAAYQESQICGRPVEYMRYDVTESVIAIARKEVVTENMLILVVNVLAVKVSLTPPPLSSAKKCAIRVKKCRSLCFSRWR